MGEKMNDSHETILRARERLEKELFRTSPSTDVNIPTNHDVFQNVPLELRCIIGCSDDELSALASVCPPAESINGPEARTLTEGERAAFDVEILVAEVLGADIVLGEPPAPLRRERIDSNAELQEMVRRTTAAVISAAKNGDRAAMAILHQKAASSNPKSASPVSVGKIVQRMAALADEFHSSAMPFLRSYVANDRAGMRAAVREILTRRA
jgi:hypothetical protein